MVLFDPPQEQREPPIVPAAVVIASSPNKRHYQNFVTIPMVHVFRVPPYKLEEVLEFFTVVGSTLPSDEIAKRFYKVPSFIYNSTFKII